MGVTMKGILFSTVAAASLFSVRGDNPFWYQDLDPATNRAAISSAVATSPTAMEYWAKQYMDHVEILEPLSLRNKIKESLESSISKYSDAEEQERGK